MRPCDAKRGGWRLHRSGGEDARLEELHDLVDHDRPATKDEHRDRDQRELFLGHLGEDVDVALHQRRFAYDRDRVTKIAQHFQDRAGDAKTPLGRLVLKGEIQDGHAVLVDLDPERDQLRFVPSGSRETAGVAGG